MNEFFNESQADRIQVVMHRLESLFYGRMDSPIDPNMPREERRYRTVLELTTAMTDLTDLAREIAQATEE